MSTTVTVVSAWDADEWGGDSWQVDYRLESGNEEEVFTLVTDRQTNEAALILDKVSSLPQYYCVIQTNIKPSCTCFKECTFKAQAYISIKGLGKVEDLKKELSVLCSFSPN